MARNYRMAARNKYAATPPIRASNVPMGRSLSIFDEQYRVVAIEGDRLFIRGILSGEVIAILNPEPETPLSTTDFPTGKLIALSNPAADPLN
jgi:hypothetical protein